MLSLKFYEVKKGFTLFVFCKKNKCNISNRINITGNLARLKVGESTVINSYANFRFKKGSISIGKGCLFGQNVTILANTYELIPNFPISPERMYSKDVNIGDYVWVGANVVILPGVTIGSNVVIGSTAVVTKDIPQGEIWGGVPARKIK